MMKTIRSVGVAAALLVTAVGCSRARQDFECTLTIHKTEGSELFGSVHAKHPRDRDTNPYFYITNADGQRVGPIHLPTTLKAGLFSSLTSQSIEPLLSVGLNKLSVEAWSGPVDGPTPPQRLAVRCGNTYVYREMPNQGIKVDNQ